MIIGKGLIASAFEQLQIDDNLIIFASGISNSKQLEDKDRNRERDLLTSTIDNHKKDKTIVYFSTYSVDNINNKNNDYVNHKVNMENTIKDSDIDYLIVRTSNIVGASGNNATVFKYLFNKIKASENFELWVNSVRNFLDVDHLALMVGELKKEGKFNTTKYLVNPIDIKVSELVLQLEKFAGKKGVYDINDNILTENQVDKSDSIALFNKLNLSTEFYIEQLLDKYYSNEKG